MKKPPIPHNETERLNALKSYSILDSLPENEYDAIVQLASFICDTPIALIGLIDEDRQWFKSKLGITDAEFPRDLSFCQYTIMGDDLLEVSNALESEIFASHPAVTSHPNIWFYAGVPLRDAAGFNLGTICVIDSTPKTLNTQQKNALKLLANQVVYLIEQRKNYIKLANSQKEYQNFMDISIDLVMIANVNGLFHKVNPALTKLLGYSKEEIEGTPFINYIHPDDLDKTYKEVEKLAKGELTLSFENRYRTKKGDYVLLSWKASPDVDTGFLYCVARDITAARKQEEELVYTTNELKAILNSSEFSIIATDIDGTIKEFNRGAEKLLGYKAEEVIGKASPAIFHKEDEVVKRSEELTIELGEKVNPGFDTFVIKARKSGIADSNEWTYIRKNGSIFPTALTVTTIKNDHGEITGYLGIAKDITRRKEAELNLLNSIKLLDESQSIAKIGSWSYDLITKEVVWSREHFRIFEMEESPSSVQLFDTYRSRVHPDDLMKLNDLFENTIKTGEGFDYEHRIIFPDKRIKNILGIWRSTKDEKGKIVSLQGTIQDITEKTSAEQKLYEKTKEIRDVRLAMDESSIVSITDQQGIFTYVNDNFCKISKFSKEELLGKDQRIISGFLSLEFAKSVLNTITKGKVWKGEIKNVAKDGSYYWEKTTIVPFLDEDGKPYQYISISADITKSKHQEEELINARNLAEHSVIAKERFLTNMSHEIRTPMNGIIGFARILEDSRLDPNQKQSVEAIKRAGENLMVIINDILDFSKIEADKMTFEGVNFSLSATANSVIELLGPKAKEQKIKLFCEIDPNMDDLLVGDPTRLSQILINLVGNALKFTVKGFVEILISQVDETETDTTVLFSIIDTGIGIPKNKIDSIFESFNQASNETTRKYGGTGLGLTITKKLIELQGGSISVKSEVSKGSEFSFMIKYKKAKKGRPVVKAKNIKQLTPDFLRELNILLVEDNDLNQLLATKVFEKWGKGIDIADNGRIAIEKIEENNYDIVLMDIQMPEMDGYAMTRFIRDNMGTKSNIPIIALTAHATIGEEQKCLDMGMDDYLSKPFDPYKLLEKMHKIIYNDDIVEYIPTKKEINSEKLIDMESLKDFAEGDLDFVKEIISLFLKNTPVTLNAIMESDKKNNLQKLNEDIHKMKSSIGLFGITKAADCVATIENELEINPSGQKRKTEIKNLNKICEAAIIELKSILESY